MVLTSRAHSIEILEIRCIDTFLALTEVRLLINCVAVLAGRQTSSLHYRAHCICGLVCHLRVARRLILLVRAHLLDCLYAVLATLSVVSLLVFLFSRLLNFLFDVIFLFNILSVHHVLSDITIFPVNIIQLLATI